MRVTDYRDLIDNLSQAFASLKSAATPQERLHEAEWVRRSARELMAAECPRAKQADRDRAEGLLDRTTSYLMETRLAAVYVQSSQPGENDG